MRFLLYIIGLFLAHFHTLGLIVEELKENAAQSFDFIKTTSGVYLGLLRQVDILSFLDCAIKPGVASVRS